MIHLRLVVPKELASRTLDLLRATPSVFSVVHLAGAAEKPAGDVILADVAREDASVVLGALKELDLDKRGTIALEQIDSAVSEAAIEAEKAATGLPSDAVVWEEVDARTSEDTELSASFLAFITIATIIAAIGVLTDSPILIIGAMVVGPEFGPLAGLCVAIVERRRELAARSLIALAVGFPVAITITVAAILLMKRSGISPQELGSTSRPLTQFISDPDWFSVIVAALAGTVGILSLTSSKSGPLIGVLISVTTIPAAGNAAVAVAYGDWDEWLGATEQLLVNFSMILLAGVTTLFVQRRLYVARRTRQRGAGYRRGAGPP